MIEKENFDVLVERAMRIANLAQMRPVIEKELFHYDILFALDDSRLLDRLTFQGGTSLRLCYGAPRLSEDLDFTGGKDFSTEQLMDMKDCIETYIGKRYGLEISIKEPKEMSIDDQTHNIQVSKWQISITVSPEKKDLPKQKIKIEVANIPAYTRVPKALRLNYDFLPDGYSDILIMTETLDEVMADKLISFVNCQKYIRYRDIWDLRWLKQQGAQMNAEYILGKLNDYHITDYLQKLESTLSHLDSTIKSKKFKDEMSRFIPMDVRERTFQKENFLDFLSAETRSLFLEVQNIVGKALVSG